jgi:hypothetical protein
VTRQERRQQLLAYLANDPLQTDEQLAERLAVSVPTVRLDRAALGIGPLKARSEQLAARLIQREGEKADQDAPVDETLVALERGHYGEARFAPRPEDGRRLGRTLAVAYLVGLAEMLAERIVPGEVVLTGLVQARCLRPIRTDEEIVAKAWLVRCTDRRLVVRVDMESAGERVFRAKFGIYALDDLAQPQGE